MAFVDPAMQELAECCPPLAGADHTKYEPIALSSPTALALVRDFDALCDGQSSWWGKAISAGMLRNDADTGKFWFMRSMRKAAGELVAQAPDGTLFVNALTSGKSTSGKSQDTSGTRDEQERLKRLPPIAVPLTAPLDAEILTFKEDMSLTTSIVRESQPLTVHKVSAKTFRLSCNRLNAGGILLFLGFIGSRLQACVPSEESALFTHDDRGLRVCYKGEWVAVNEAGDKLIAVTGFGPTPPDNRMVHLHIHSKQSSCVYLRRHPPM